jgi:hypothetical protein
MFESFAGFEINEYYTKLSCVHSFVAFEPMQKIHESLLGWLMVALSNVYRITWAAVHHRRKRKRLYRDDESLMTCPTCMIDSHENRDCLLLLPAVDQKFNYSFDDDSPIKLTTNYLAEQRDNNWCVGWAY